ncbi:MAG TPA: LON peptidase substrate-binding domain-containing protein [Bryobacteraceae bacterium]
MGTQLLPLFPLGVVLVPAMPLPLHIFEERYKELMNDIVPLSAEFGVVLAKQEGIANVGCTATVEQIVNKYPDGRMDLIALGRRRFKVSSLDDGKHYLRAAVEFFDDENELDPPANLRGKAIAAYRQLSRLEGAEESEDEPMPQNPMSFQIAQLIFDVEKRLTILSLRSETERLQYISSMLPEYAAQRGQALAAKRLAPQNGHARHVSGT